MDVILVYGCYTTDLMYGLTCYMLYFTGVWMLYSTSDVWMLYLVYGCYTTDVCYTPHLMYGCYTCGVWMLYTTSGVWMLYSTSDVWMLYH